MNKQSYTRTASFLLGLLTLWGLRVGAEGSNELTPSANDAPVMLETGREGFGLFADYESDENGRLIVSIASPEEVVFLGLAPEYNDDGRRFNGDAFSSYFFRIRRASDGAVVHGPFRVNNSTANANSQAEAVFGNYATTRTVGGVSVYEFQPQAAGDYIIEFQDAETDNFPRVQIPFWDITVVRDGEVRPGRLWSRNWSFRTPPIRPLEEPECVWNRPFNGDLYSYTEDGFVSRIDFNEAGMQGLSFTVAFNDSGPGNTGDIAIDRMSIPDTNATQGTAQHRIFLTLPDVELFPDGICGEVTSGSTFNCNGTEGFCLDVAVTRPGQVEIILDFNGNGLFDPGSLDRLLTYEFVEDTLSACVPWDGLRGDSTAVTFADTVDLFINYAQGVQHWSAFDVEFMKNGFCVETVRPICSQEITSNILYWDDRNIPEDPGTDAPKDQRNGCPCEDGCRTWNFFELNSEGACDMFEDSLTNGYGDKNTLNTYWFANSSMVGQAMVPLVTAVIVGPTNLCEGDTVTLSAQNASILGSPTYFWTGPNVDGATTPMVDVFATGEYCVTVSDNQGCSSETCTTVDVLALNAEQFPDELTICAGDSLLLPVAGAEDFEYEWSPATGLDDPTSNRPTFAPSETTTYTVEVTNENVDGQSCSRTEVVVIVVVPDLNLQVRGGGLICADSANITASTDAISTISLFDPAGNLVETGNDFTLPLSGNSDYLILAETDSGCQDSVIFSVSGGPTNVSLQDTTIDCLSDGLSLTVNNLDLNDTLSYDWQPADLFDPNTLDSPNPAFVGAPGEYSVTVTTTNQFGCEATDTATVVVIDDGGNLAFESELDCSGNIVQFNYTGNVDFGLVYDFGDGTTSNEMNPSKEYTTPGTYDVTLSLVYDQNCVASFTESVTTFTSVLDADFTFDLGDCEDGSASVSFVEATTNATGEAIDYVWTFTGADQASSTEANPTVTVSQGGTVSASLTVTSESDCSASFDTTFSVALPEIGLADEITICPGDSTALNPGADETQTYTWSPAPDFDPSTPNPVTSVPGIYTVVVGVDAADLNCTVADTVTVIAADSIGLVVNGPDGNPLSGGAAGGGGGNGGGAGGGNGGGGADIVLPTITSCGEATELTVDLSATSNADVTYTRPDGTVIGSGESISLTTPNGRDTVIITATDQFGCLERDTVVIINSQVDAEPNVGSEGIVVCAATDTTITINNLDPRDTLTYNWAAADIINGPLDGETVDITTPSEGSVDLTVLVTNQFGCDTTLTVTVSATPFTPNSFPGAVQACFAQQTTIVGGTAIDGYTYVWEPAAGLDLTDPANPMGSFTEDTDLTVTITDPETGCSETQMVAVAVQPQVALSVNPADTSICTPDSISVGALAANENSVIAWYDDAALTNQVGTGNEFTVLATEVGQSYTVFAEARDTVTGCSEVQPVTINVTNLNNGLPQTAISLCAGERASIFGAGGPDDALEYTYEPAEGVDLSDPSDPVFTGNESGTLSVTATDPATGCSTVQEVAIEVDNLDGLTGSADPESIILGQSSTLTVFGCEGDCTYEWFPPNGTIEPDNGPEVIATPSESGLAVYEIEVTRDGCTDIVEIELRVDDPFCDTDQIYIPNAFTPNGDNMNDVLRVRSRFAEQLTEFELIIYNRWGQEVFSTDDINQSWDGTSEGDELEPDVYGYWFRVLCPEGEELIQQGNVTILK